MRPRTLDLFCGAGGSSIGARRAGAEIVCGVDAWDIATATFGDNFPEARSLTARLDGRSTKKTVGDIGSIDLILASPECTNHTCAKGAAPRDEKSRKTANFVLAYARSYKPRWIIIENVIQMRSWPGYQALVGRLKENYFVREQVIDSAHHGAPQRRRRLFLICDAEFMPPEILPSSGEATPASRFIRYDSKWPMSPVDNGRRAEATLARANRAVSALGEGVPFLLVYYGNDAAGGWQALNRPLRTVTTVDRFALVLWRDGVPYMRMLQVPELKDAMGHGQAFLMQHGTRRDKVKLLGNGVSPNVVKAIVQTVCNNREAALDDFAQAVAAE